MNVQDYIDQNPRFIAAEAAIYLGTTEHTLNTWRTRGGGPKFVKLGRAVRYFKSDLDAWIESRKVTFNGELAERQAR